MQIPARSVPIERPCLYLVATPIGNLDDITLRALAVLRDSDLVLAEDTRIARRLLDHYAIAQTVVAVHEHNEREVAGSLIARVARDRLSVALVSDAGTPLISDPGYPLLREALATGVAVRAVPGAWAGLAALCVSGLPTDRFAFEGFLPRKDAAARAALATLATDSRTLILYEAPRRIRRTLELVVEVVGEDRQLCVARELTKLHETVYRGTASEVLTRVREDPGGELGEFVILIAPAPRQTLADAPVTALLRELAPHLSRSRAVAVAAAALQRSRKEVYRLALAIETFET